MPETIDLNVIREQIDRDEARAALSVGAQDMSAVVERKVYYPYRHFEASCDAPVLFGFENGCIDCLVDGVNDVAATADAIALDKQTVPSNCVIATSDDVASSLRQARRYLSHHIGRRLRTIADFRIRLKAAGTVYKAFWIGHVGGRRYMIDSVTGETSTIG